MLLIKFAQVSSLLKQGNSNLPFYLYNNNLIIMSFAQFEENCEPDTQFDTNIEEFTKKALIFQSIEHLNKKTSIQTQASQREDITYQRISLQQSAQIFSEIPFSDKKQYSLNEALINQAFQRIATSTQSKKQVRTVRKRLTIEKKIKTQKPVDGEGVAKLENGETIFATWKDGTTCGQVKIVYPTGNIYIGSVKNYIRHGIGVYLFQDGRRYEGEFKDGSISGYGVLTDSAGEVIARGLWSDGRLFQATY